MLLAVRGHLWRRRNQPPPSSQLVRCRFFTTVLFSRLVGVVGGSTPTPVLMKKSQMNYCAWGSGGQGEFKIVLAVPM